MTDLSRVNPYCRICDNHVGCNGPCTGIEGEGRPSRRPLPCWQPAGNRPGQFDAITCEPAPEPARIGGADVRQRLSENPAEYIEAVPQPSPRAPGLPLPGARTAATGQVSPCPLADAEAVEADQASAGSRAPARVSPRPVRAPSVCHALLHGR